MRLLRRTTGRRGFKPTPEGGFIITARGKRVGILARLPGRPRTYRYFTTGGPFDFEVTHADNGTEVILREVATGKELGNLQMLPLDRWAGRSPECGCVMDTAIAQQAPLYVIHSAIDGQTFPGPWEAMAERADFRQQERMRLRGKGLGLALYLSGLSAMHIHEPDALFTPGACHLQAGTTDEAWRVWDSLTREAGIEAVCEPTARWRGRFRRFPGIRLRQPVGYAI